MMENTKSVPLELMTSSGPTLSTTPSFQQFLKQSTAHPVNGVCVCVFVYMLVCCVCVCIVRMCPCLCPCLCLCVCLRVVYAYAYMLSTIA